MVYIKNEFSGDTMMNYCSSGGATGTTGNNGNASPPSSSQLPCSSGGGTPPVSSGTSPPNGTVGGNEEEDVWRGHSIAALRRRASELNAAIPSYLQINYDTHNNASVY